MYFLLFYTIGTIIQGTISKIDGRTYSVIIGGNAREVICSLRGRLNHDFRMKRDKRFALDVAVVGDDVEVLMQQDGSGVITEVLPRKNFLSRKAAKIKGAGYRGERLEQIICSNLSKFYIIVSVDFPLFNNKTLDRFLVTGEVNKLDTSIIVNKMDLNSGGIMEEFIELYREIGYEVFPVSTKSKKGLKQLYSSLLGNRSAFWGNSGVGKSSLLNALFSDLNLVVGDISFSTNKGKHTTVNVSMFSFEEENNVTQVIDTPGIREIEPYGVKKEDLGHYFPDFVSFINKCKYNTCTHEHEPGCAVAEAVENGFIDPMRYDSYLKLLETIESDMFF